MLKAYLMTELARQLAGGLDRFRSRFPHPWLVWEPGAWKVGAPFEETLLPGDSEIQDALLRGDALCFALDTKPGPQCLKIGRSIGNDVVVNDATVSREHLLLTRDVVGQWAVEATAEGNTFCREPLKPGAPRTIVRGDQIRIGDVTLTFYDLVGMVERLGG